MSAFRIISALSSAALLFGCSNGGQSAQPRQDIQAPTEQESFLRIVTAAQSESRAAENDMQRGGINSRRDKQLCETMSALIAKHWIGTVKSVSSNSDGKGVLEIEIPRTSV